MLSGKEVLLVDDEESIINALQRELRGWAKSKGLGFLSAASGADALRHLEDRSSSIALIISDLRMPGQKGSDLLMQVKNSYPDIPAILLTGFTETEEMLRAIKAGIFSYILKPWDHDYLVSEIDKALQLYTLRKENEHYVAMLREQLAWAGELQRTMFTLNLPPSEAVSFSVAYQPVVSLQCGGDYYDVIRLGDERYLILVGDVSGHGVGAAFIAAILKSVIFNEYVRNRIKSDLSPAEFLDWLSARMYPLLQKTPGIIFSFCAAVLDVGKGRLVYSNAGHEPICLLRGSGFELLHVAGPGIGFVEDVEFIEKETAVEEGDVLVFYTDGISESSDGERRRVDHRLLGEFFFRECGGGKCPSDVHKAAKESLDVKEFKDDVTILVASIEKRNKK